MTRPCTGYDGPDNRWVMLNEYEEARLSTYDDEGHLISFQDYDEAGNLTRRWEYDTEGNVISSTTY